MNVVKPMVGGSAKSESGFEPKLDAEFVGKGMDFIHNDPDGKVMRLDAHQVLRWVLPASLRVLLIDLGVGGLVVDYGVGLMMVL